MGPASLGTLGPGADTLAVMRLRPDVEASSCRHWIFGVPLDSDRRADEDLVASMVTELLSRDPEANVFSEGSVQWDRFCMGFYERQCIMVHGVLARTIRTVTIPLGADPHDHQH